MDCETLKLEQIRHERARLSTFKKRKHNLMKKAHEFSTLCDVDVCVIVYWPKLDGQSVKPETWTSRGSDLISIIRKYKLTISAGGDHGRRGTSSSAKTACKRNCIRNFNTWDQRIDSFSEDQLKMILRAMDNKLKVVDRKLNMIKGGDQNLMSKATLRKLDHDSHLNDAKSPVNMKPETTIPLTQLTLSSWLSD